MNVTEAGLNELYRLLGKEIHAGAESTILVAALKAKNEQMVAALTEVQARYGPKADPPPDGETEAIEQTGPSDQEGPVSLSSRRPAGQIPDTEAGG